MDSLSTPVMIFIALALAVALVGLIVAFNDRSVKNDYVVIFYEGIHICGYVEKAKLRNDIWEIELRGGAKIEYKHVIAWREMPEAYVIKEETNNG